jgi:hypothetical protein
MLLTPGQRRLYSGDYNYLSQAGQPDGTVIVTISGGQSGQTDRMHIRDLWGENEEVLTEEIMPSGPPLHIAARLAEAAAPVDVVGAPLAAPEEVPHGQ